MTISQFATRLPESPRPSAGPRGFRSLATSDDRRSQGSGTSSAGIVVTVMVLLFLQPEVADAGGGSHDQLQPEIAYQGGSQDQLPPKILVLRGAFEVFSLGMNDLAKKLRCQGYDAKATSWALALLEAKCSDQQPIVVVGHSLGGRMCGWVPRKLRKCGKRVPLVIIVDANLIQRIPDNVDKCVHLYVTNPLGIFHGSPVRGESAETNIVNWDVSRGQPSFLQGGVNHFNIDATDWVHDIIIDEIAKTFPAPGHNSFAGFTPAVEAVLDSEPPHQERGENHFATCTLAPLGREQGEGMNNGSNSSRVPTSPPVQVATHAATFSDPALRSPQVHHAERKLESEVKVVGWRPARPQAKHESAGERSEASPAVANADQPGSRPPRIRIPNAGPETGTNVAHPAAAERGQAGAKKVDTDQPRTSPPRIRLPQHTLDS